ncbi:unnamed protein product [Orchesella dallaii]|uniref:FMN hydroxy acid dehydrogenase domain-containing protein n=1 Tax=Orchesella dallaii TaxID=48710 RepID=A0ABP1QKG9_9HEXA
MDKLVCIKDFMLAVENIWDSNLNAYYNCGADDEITVQENRDAFIRWKLRPRLLRGVSKRSLFTTVLGKPVNFPVGIAPTAMHQMAHPEGELATARAADNSGTIFIQSLHSTYSIEEVAHAAPNSRKWLQMALIKDRNKMIEVALRAKRVGFEAIVLSVDTCTFGIRRNIRRLPFKLPAGIRLANLEEDEMNVNPDGFNFTQHSELTLDCGATWDLIQFLKSATDMPIIAKGIQTFEDAVLAVNNGADAIFVSNHGGRQLDGVIPTIDILQEVVESVGEHVEVYVDGGVMRGSDVFKAIAIGAKMAFIGRPILWGLGVGGQEGVQKVLNILKEELDITMALTGVRSVSEISPEFVRTVTQLKTLKTKC